MILTLFAEKKQLLNGITDAYNKDQLIAFITNSIN